MILVLDVTDHTQLECQGIEIYTIYTYVDKTES